MCYYQTITSISGSDKNGLFFNSMGMTLVNMRGQDCFLEVSFIDDSQRVICSAFSNTSALSAIC